MATVLALNWQLVGDPSQSASAMDRSGRKLEEIRCPACAAFFHGAAAELYAELADADATFPHISRAQELGTELDRMPTVLAAERADAVLKLRADDAAGALQQLRNAWVLADALGQPYEAAKTAHLLGRAYHAHGSEGDSRRAREHLSRALSIFEELKAQPEIAAVTATMRKQELP